MPRATKDDAQRVHITIKGPMLTAIQAAIAGTGYTVKEWALASMRRRLQTDQAPRYVPPAEAPRTAAPLPEPPPAQREPVATDDEGPGF